MGIPQATPSSSKTASLRCIRFQYQKGAVNPPAFETLPFYLVKIRSFLKRNLGHTAWFKGNSGGERAAWLVYDQTVTSQVVKLFDEPLDAGGYFKVTMAPGDATDIIERYLIRDEVDIVGSVEMLEFILGSREPPRVGPKPWWEKFDWQQSFWYLGPRYGDRKQYRHICAKKATSHEDKKGLMLRLHGCVETAIAYRGRDPPELWVDTHEGDPSFPKYDPKEDGVFYLWEKDAREWIAENVTLEDVRREEPEWNNFLDAIKIGGQ